MMIVNLGAQAAFVTERAVELDGNPEIKRRERVYAHHPTITRERLSDQEWVDENLDGLYHMTAS